MKSYLSGVWDKINPSFVDVKSVNVDFVNLNIIAESALLDLQIKCPVVNEIGWEECCQKSHNVAYRRDAEGDVNRARVTNMFLTLNHRESEG